MLYIHLSLIEYNYSTLKIDLKFCILYSFCYSALGITGIIPPNPASQGFCGLSPPPTVQPTARLAASSHKSSFSFFLRFSVPAKIVIPVSSSS